MKKTIILLLLCFVLSACTNKGEEKTDYEQTKKLTVDLLKTDEGKKAIRDVVKKEGMQQEVIMDQAVVTDAIQLALASPEAEKFWKKSFEDTKFTEAMAKGMKKENEKLLKELMKDPEYQAMMLEVLSDPTFQEEQTKALKSAAFRTHLQEVIIETVDNPLFKEKLEKSLLKAAKEMEKKEKEKKAQKKKKEGMDGKEAK